MELLSSDLDSGVNIAFLVSAGERKDVHTLGNTNPGEPLNMNFLCCREMHPISAAKFLSKC